MEKTINKNTDSGVVQESKKTENILKWIDVSLLAAVQTLTTIFFLIGFMPVFGESFTPLSIFYVIGDLFEYNNVIAYRLINSTILAVFYVFILVVVIIKLIKTVKQLFMLKKYGKLTSVQTIKENCAYVFLFCLVFVIVSNAFYSNQINPMITATICLTGAALTFNEFAYSFITTKKPSVSEFILRCLKFLIGFSVVSLVFMLLNQPVISDFIESVDRATFGLLFTEDRFESPVKFFNCFIMPVLYVVLAILFLKSCKLQFSASSVERNITRRKVKKAWILSIVILISQFIFNGLIMSKFQEISIRILSSWWYSVKSVYFPLFLLLTAWFLALKFTPKEVSD